DEFGDCGEIIAPIARDKDNYVRRTVRDDGEFAHTRFRTVERGERYCLHEVTLFTGRTHQIRVHFAYIGYPLVGDKLYGGDTSVMKRQALHCGKLELDHPITKEHISVTSELPEDMSILLCKKSV
ncbi:MAG: RluA family pseudouridine synthase, partial [Ruminiclostridium sp.]|nr:RluA family pseudouridine synthase [Ruminiclostridium sp.]